MWVKPPRVRIPDSPPRRSKRHVVCSDLFYKLERTHFVAPPLQTEPAVLGFGFVNCRSVSIRLAILFCPRQLARLWFNIIPKNNRTRAHFKVSTNSKVRTCHLFHTPVKSKYKKNTKSREFFKPDVQHPRFRGVKKQSARVKVGHVISKQVKIERMEL